MVVEIRKKNTRFKDKGDNLVASGVLMEAWSVEDAGSGICFNVYCYNVQPGIEIDYSNGDSERNGDIIVNKKDENANEIEKGDNSEKVIERNTNAKEKYVWISATGTKYHSRNDCGRMNPNTAEKISEVEAEKRGFAKCSRCWRLTE